MILMIACSSVCSAGNVNTLAETPEPVGRTARLSVALSAAGFPVAPVLQER
jgi:hypothetical protein